MSTSALDRALANSRAFAATVHASALRIRAAGGGVAGGLIEMGGGMSSIGDFKDQSAARERYGLFRDWLYSAVNAIASEGAGQPIVVGRMRGARKKDERGGPSQVKLTGAMRMRMTADARTKAANHEVEVLVEHDLVDVLAQPNPIQGPWQFAYSFIANLALTGWAYVVGGENSEGRLEYYSLPTTWVRPNHSQGPFSQFRIVDPKNPSAWADAKPLGRENVAFAHLPNPADPMSALAPSSAQITSIRIDDHIQTSRDQFFHNGIFPSVVVEIGKDPHPNVQAGIRPRLTGAQRRQVTGAIRKVMGGVANYGNPAIIDGLIESITKFSNTANEMGWEKSEGLIRTRILSAYAVHQFILGEAVSVGGYSQAFIIENRFYKRVNTYLNMLGTLMTNLVNGEDSAERLLVWWTECEAVDPALYWSNLNAARNRGDVTRNEVRAKLGLPPDETGGDNTRSYTAGDLNAIAAIQAQVANGMMLPEQASLIYRVAFDMTPEDAAVLAGPEREPEPTPEEQALVGASDELKRAVGVLSTPVSAISDRILARCRIKYDPDQPRDDHGRWGSGGGGGGMVPANPDGRDTMEQYRTSDGRWTPERAALHERIIGHYMEGKSPVDQPMAYVMGGGPAAGKSTAIRVGEISIPENAVHIDPDDIKMNHLPEFKREVAAGNRGASSYVHEESSHVSKAMQKKASDAGYNTLLDGTGDGDVDWLASKVAVMRGRGQQVVAHYVTVDTDVAVARSLSRAAKTGRYVPESVIRETHAGVSRVFPEAVRRGLFDEFTLWDTNDGATTKVVSGRGREMTVHSPALWERFLAKGR